MMGHGHDHHHGHRHCNHGGHGHHHHHQHVGEGNLRFAFFLNLTFTLIEIGGGFWTNSIAILSDAVHDFGDSVALGLAWALQRYSRREADVDYSFGYRRFSLLGGVLTAAILIVGSALILAHAVQRVFDPPQPYAPGMVGLAVLGVAANGIAMLRLRRGESYNERIASWHLLEDVMGWMAVLVVSIVLLFVDLPVLDPLLSIGISAWVIYNVIGSFREMGKIFLQGVPDRRTLSAIKEEIGSMEHVTSLHHTHLWSLDGEHHVLTTHVVVSAETTRDDVAQIKHQINCLRERYSLEHVTVEVEYGEGNCCMEGRSEPMGEDKGDS